MFMNKFIAKTIMDNLLQTDVNIDDYITLSGNAAILRCFHFRTWLPAMPENFAWHSEKSARKPSSKLDISCERAFEFRDTALDAIIWYNDKNVKGDRNGFFND